MTRERGFIPKPHPHPHPEQEKSSPENEPMKPLINELGLNFKINNLRFKYEKGLIEKESFKKGLEDILVEDLKARLEAEEIDQRQYEEEFESIPNKVKEIMEDS